MARPETLIGLVCIKPSLTREKLPFKEQAIRNLSLRGGSSEDITRIIMASISGVRTDTQTQTNGEKEIALAGRFLARGLFSENLTSWSTMLSVVNKGNKTTRRSFPALLCLEAFLDARERGDIDGYYDDLMNAFGKLPSSLANGQRAITNRFSHKNLVVFKSTGPDLSLDIHRFRRSEGENGDAVVESRLDVEESEFFEQKV